MVEDLTGHITIIYNELKSQVQQTLDYSKEHAVVCRKIQPISKVGDQVWFL